MEGFSALNFAFDKKDFPTAQNLWEQLLPCSSATIDATAHGTYCQSVSMKTTRVLCKGIMMINLFDVGLFLQFLLS